MKNAFDVLKERGFIEQCTHENEINTLLRDEKVHFYIGFDPTADSLTVGHFLTVMAMSHLQKAGHTPIVLVGGGTGMVGDPTDRTEMRRVMTKQEVSHNCECFKKQLSKFIDFDDNKAIMVNNAEWLLDLKYIEFIREYGIHFSVNKMLTADSYKSRFEKGLSFFEFNYMLMQAYDFLELNKRYNCKLQLGGNDQWSNIIAGVDLIRRVLAKDSYGMTFKLLTTSDGKKMGKSQNGAIWLDASKTSAYEFFQYWRNIEDEIVGSCLSLLTYIEMDEIYELRKLQDKHINLAKERLAFEITKIVHGQDLAQESQDASKSLFEGNKQSNLIPTFELKKEIFGESMLLIDLLVVSTILPSKSEARRNITQGGIKIFDQKIEDIDYKILDSTFVENEILIQKGKKTYLKIKLI